MYRVFEDRRTAGRALVPELQRCKLDDPIILGLPRGGVPLAYEIAMALRAPLDTIVDRVICLESPASFYAVGQFYVDFGQTTDGEVRELLCEAWETLDSPGAPTEGHADE